MAGGLANMCPYEGEARTAVRGSEEAADEEEAKGRAICRAAPEAGGAGRAASGACDGAAGRGATESAGEGDVRGRARVSAAGEGAVGRSVGALRGAREPRAPDRRGGGEGRAGEGDAGAEDPRGEAAEPGVGTSWSGLLRAVPRSGAEDADRSAQRVVLRAQQRAEAPAEAGRGARSVRVGVLVRRVEGTRRLALPPRRRGPRRRAPDLARRLRLETRETPDLPHRRPPGRTPMKPRRPPWHASRPPGGDAPSLRPVHRVGNRSHRGTNGSGCRRDGWAGASVTSCDAPDPSHTAWPEQRPGLAP